MRRRNATATAQRSSPQFSFPPPSFGSDVFANANNQDLSALSQLGAPSLPQQLPPLSPLEPQQTQPGGQPQLISQAAAAQSAGQQQSARPSQQAADQQGANIQLSRPSLSLTSLSANQQQQSAGQQTAQQRPSAAASSVSASAGASSRDSHQSTRHSHSQQPQPPAPQPAPAHRPAQSHTLNSARQHQHPANLQTQQTSQAAAALAAGSNQQAAIEAARKAEATAASLATANGQTYHCPDSFGYFRHHKSCDKYWACENNTATLKLCGNGLMFDDADPKRENCAYPFSVDCGDRTDLGEYWRRVARRIARSPCARLASLEARAPNLEIASAHCPRAALGSARLTEPDLAEHWPRRLERAMASRDKTPQVSIVTDSESGAAAAARSREP